MATKKKGKKRTHTLRSKDSVATLAYKAKRKRASGMSLTDIAAAIGYPRGTGQQRVKRLLEM